MLTNADKQRQLKKILMGALPVIKKEAPWLDFDQLKLGKANSTYSKEGSLSLYLFFQPCADRYGKIISPGRYCYRDAEYFEEIYKNLPNKLASLKENDPQITGIHCATWSTINVIVKGMSPDVYSYYGIQLFITYNDFVKGDMVKVKPLYKGKVSLDPSQIYTVKEDQTPETGVVIVETKTVRTPAPDYILYKV